MNPGQATAAPPRYLRVAVALPLARAYDYRLPAGMPEPQPGCRVLVPFNHRDRVGFVLGCGPETDYDPEKVQPLVRVLDEEPMFPISVWKLIQWCWGYYHHPPGEVIVQALPPALRGVKSLVDPDPAGYRLATTPNRPEASTLRKRAARQAELLTLLESGPRPLSRLLELNGNPRAVIRGLIKKGWVEPATADELRLPASPGPELTAEQGQAVKAVSESLGSFGRYLLDGVTGSGKTEVYIRLIEDVISRGEQALVLVPEIGLTPQLIERFRKRLGVDPLVSHSGLADGARQKCWAQAARGDSPVVIGTRSAVFLPLKNPGIIIVDEEHDSSFKQQDRLRYSARDVAIKRAEIEQVPVLLGTATPSLETLNNALTGRYVHLALTERPGGGALPGWELDDLKKQQLNEGLSPNVLSMLDQCLAAGEQALVFLNRRGYAPVLMCHDCGWAGDCSRCDAHLTLHRSARQLRCHRCGYRQRLPLQCPDCGSLELVAVGEGTERLAQFLSARFPQYPVLQVDRDSTRKKGSLEHISRQVREGNPLILVGTQMLAKGHHFPSLSLAVIVNADQALFSVDFRATERLAQLLTQVAGRSGRGEVSGKVVVQTHHPDSPLLDAVFRQGYASLARDLLAERQAAQLAPFRFQATLRTESLDERTLSQFIGNAADLLPDDPELERFGPMPALQPRRAGRFRQQIMVQSAHRAKLHQTLASWLPAIATIKQSSKVRWVIDVDPQEF